jgi:hypothetical protein
LCETRQILGGRDNFEVWGARASPRLRLTKKKEKQEEEEGEREKEERKL